MQGESWAVTVVINYAFISKQTKKINRMKSLTIMTYQVPNYAFAPFLSMIDWICEVLYP